MKKSSYYDRWIVVVVVIVVVEKINVEHYSNTFKIINLKLRILDNHGNVLL